MTAGKMSDGLGHLDELVFFSEAKPNLARTGYFSASSCRGLHLPEITSEFNFSELSNKSLLGLEALPSTRWSIFSSLMTFHLSSFVFSSASNSNQPQKLSHPSGIWEVSLSLLLSVTCGDFRVSCFTRQEVLVTTRRFKIPQS